jgi:hypothetical protein
MFCDQSESEDGRWSGLDGFEEVTSSGSSGHRGVTPHPGESAESADSVKEGASGAAHALIHRGYERELIQSVWEFAEIVPGNDPEIWRKDEFGDWIYRFDYGRRSSELGWEIFDPGVGRHAQGVYAMRPMQWQSYIRQYETFA